MGTLLRGRKELSFIDTFLKGMFGSKIVARVELGMSRANEGPTTKLTRLYEEGKEALSARNYKKAIKKFDKAVTEFDPVSDTSHDKAIVLCARSAAKYHWGKYEESLQDAELAVQTKPDSSKEEDPRSLDIIELRIVRLNQDRDAEENGMYFRQLRPGLELCRGSYNPVKKLVHEFARGMQNIVYVVGDTVSRECLIFDACWDSDGIIEAITKDGMTPIGCVITHNHFDHVGGKPPPPFRSYGVTVQGVKNILEKYSKIPVYIHQDDADTFQDDSGVDPGRIITTCDGFEIAVGEVKFKVIHTPGHTPGSQCFLVNNTRLITGDTLFPSSCGRMDLPGGCSTAMFDSLQNRLGSLPCSTVVYPGHSYGNYTLSTIGRERRVGVLKPKSLEEWLGEQGKR